MSSVADLILHSRPPVICNESDLQNWLEDLFERSGVDAQREVRLSARNRVDFMVGGIAIETKVDGSLSSILRQLDRYAECDQVEEVLLVTTLRKHLTTPFELRGKHVEVAWVATL